MSKDPFQILADEITLIRSEIERLQRTSLDKDEAKALHDIVAKSVTDLKKAAPALGQSVDERLKIAVAEVEAQTTKAAKEAARDAVHENHSVVVKAAQGLLDDAQTVRRVTRRHYGNFWATVVSVGAVCALIASLVTVAVQGRAERSAVQKYGPIECKIKGGAEINLSDGGTACGFRMS